MVIIKNRFFVALILILLLVVSSYLTFAQPESFTILNSTSSRRNFTGITSLPVIAGNVTALSIHGSTTTQTWHGFFGNISGSLVLSNGANQMMYDWNISSARGQIYATTNSSINWALGNINCYNFSITNYVDYFTLDYLENSFNIPSHADDGINETFKGITHPSFYVGYNVIPPNRCHSTNLYSSGVPSTNFTQTILYANDSRSVVFTSLMDGKNIGFDGSPMDFQMIVPADGRNGSTTPTTYYMYIELR